MSTFFIHSLLQTQPGESAANLRPGPALTGLLICSGAARFLSRRSPNRQPQSVPARGWVKMAATLEPDRARKSPGPLSPHYSADFFKQADATHTSPVSHRLDRFTPPRS